MSGNRDAFIFQQVEDGFGSLVGTTRKLVAHFSFTGQFVTVHHESMLPIFTAAGTLVTLGVLGQALDITEVVSVQVQVHRGGVSTVGLAD